MEFWLKQGEGATRLPVKPTDFNVTVAHKNTVVNVIQLGDINLMGKTGLREISLSSFFPAMDYNFSYNIGRKDPIEYVNQIEKWRKSGKPVRVLITDLLNMEATIESFTWGGRDATGDIYYTMALKEYKSLKSKDNTGNSSSRRSKDPESSSGKTYVVKRGDSLWGISKKFYGNGNLFLKIQLANPSIKNPNILSVGQVIKIP